MPRLVVFAALIACCFNDVSADVTLNEEDFGGFSMNLAAPTPIGELEIGTTTVQGVLLNLEMAPTDVDVFTFSVAQGRALDSVALLSIEGDRHFFGIDEGTSTTDASGGNALLVATLVGGANINTNYLQTTPLQRTFGGTHEPGSLGPGDYTIWIQEWTDVGEFSYTLQLQTTVSAIPEPSSLFALGALGTCVALRRRRRS